MALKTWTTTYRELLGRLSAIRQGIPGSSDDVPLARRKLPGGALLALRRFTRVCDEHVKDFQAEQQVLAKEAQDRGVGVGEPFPIDLEDQFQQLLATEVDVQVSAVPADVFLEDGAVTLFDLELLEPLLEE